MKLPASLTSNTFLKIFAIALFVLLPFVGFWLGMKYQEYLQPKEYIIGGILEVQTDKLVICAVPNDCIEIKNDHVLLARPLFPLDHKNVIANMKKVAGEAYLLAISEEEDKSVSNPTPTPNQISNWKTYTNSKFRLAFQYPTNLKITEQVNEKHLDITPLATSVNPSPSALFSITYFDNPDNLSLEQFEKAHTGTSGYGPGVYMPNAETKIVGGLTADYRHNTNCEPALCDKYVIPRPNSIIFIVNHTGSYGNNENQQEVFSRILSTFTFTDSQTPDILVSIRSVGGLCPEGVCSSEQLILRDGSSAIVNHIKGTSVDRNDILVLINLVDTADYEKIRSTKFTGVCARAYDGQEIIYTFYTLQGVEQISSCTTEIDNTLPLFSKIQGVLK